jgi:hypothetical protein
LRNGGIGGKDQLYEVHEAAGSHEGEGLESFIAEREGHAAAGHLGGGDV